MDGMDGEGGSVPYEWYSWTSPLWMVWVGQYPIDDVGDPIPMDDTVRPVPYGLFG